MKKLYQNIEDIHITGGIEQLSDAVSNMDRILQNITDCTDKLTNYLIKYSSTNKGLQYQKVVRTSTSLRDKLFEKSLELNDMQNQIVLYQNKIYRYEDINRSASKPNPYLINKKNVVVDTSAVKFTRDDMINLVANINNYCERVRFHIRNLVEKKNSMAGFWKDSQYRDFSSFIDDISKDVLAAIKIYSDYVVVLEEKIKELN